MLDRIRVVLIQTSHPGNIGSTARAMKNMGLSNLYLVSPLSFPDTKASEMASGALDILAKAKVVATLDDAIGDCNLVIGTSARSRKIPWPLLNPREAAEKVTAEPSHSEIAFLFGREQSGLSNTELQRCHIHLHIPSNPDYSSLNLSQAVQIIAYELRMATEAKAREEVEWDYQLATTEDVEKLYQHLEKVLILIDFLNPTAPRQLMARLRRLFNRTRLDKMELNILRGILTAVEKRI